MAIAGLSPDQTEVESLRQRDFLYILANLENHHLRRKEPGGNPVPFFLVNN